MYRNSPNFASIRSQHRQSPRVGKSRSQRIDVGSSYPADFQNPENNERVYRKNTISDREGNYQDEPYNFRRGQNPGQGKGFWKGPNQKPYPTPRSNYNASPMKVAQSEVNFRQSGDNYFRNKSGNTQDFISRNDPQMQEAQKPVKKYNKFLNGRGRGIRNMNRPASPRIYRNEESYKSLHGQMGQKPAHSVKSVQQQVYLNQYEDDCLYMNLEEEYLHRVSKRQGKSTNVSINRSMYNFK